MGSITNFTEAQKILEAIKKQHTPDELRRIFNKRLDDEMFYRLGAAAYGVSKAKKMPYHKVVFLGFELAVNSPCLEKRFRAIVNGYRRRPSNG